MRILATLPVLFCAASLGWASAQTKVTEEWTGMYIQGAKVGFSRSASTQDSQGKRVDGNSTIRAEMLGAKLEMEIESSTFYDAEGKLTKLVFLMNSSGRRMKVTADFKPTEILAVSQSDGAETKKTLTIPKGSLVVDDPTSYILEAGPVRRSFLVFDPNSLSLVEVKVTDQGMKDTTVKGKGVKGRQILVDDPRAPMTMWLDGKNDLLIARGPMGMEIIPEPKLEAMKLSGSADIAEASAIRTNKPLDPSAASAKLTIKGANKSRFADGPGQKVEQVGDAVVITLKPVDPMENLGTLKVGQTSVKTEWTTPDLRVPSSQPEFKTQAMEIIGTETNAVKAAEKVRQWVLSQVQVNAGIGVMRDAREVLDSKEGVCRDHAVLMASLLRSVQIPTQLVSGVVYQSGQFYYHAWVEIWNGERWLAMDSTRPSSRLTSGHVKIASGSVADAFVSFLIDQRVIEVVQP